LMAMILLPYIAVSKKP